MRKLIKRTLTTLVVGTATIFAGATLYTKGFNDGADKADNFYVPVIKKQDEFISIQNRATDLLLESVQNLNALTKDPYNVEALRGVASLSDKFAKYQGELTSFRVEAEEILKKVKESRPAN